MKVVWTNKTSNPSIRIFIYPLPRIWPWSAVHHDAIDGLGLPVGASCEVVVIKIRSIPPIPWFAIPLLVLATWRSRVSSNPCIQTILIVEEGFNKVIFLLTMDWDKCCFSSTQFVTMASGIRPALRRPLNISVALILPFPESLSTFYLTKKT